MNDLGDDDREQGHTARTLLRLLPLSALVYDRVEWNPKFIVDTGRCTLSWWLWGKSDGTLASKEGKGMATLQSSSSPVRVTLMPKIQLCAAPRLETNPEMKP